MEAISTVKIILTSKEAEIISKFYRMLGDDINMELSNANMVEIMDSITYMYLVKKKDVDTAYLSDSPEDIEIIIEESEE